jgi:hypothetical protein
MTLHTRRGRYVLLGAVAAAIALSTTGCHVPDPYPATPSTEATKALDELESLPSLEDTKTQLQDAVKEITTAATQLLPALTWDNLHGDTTGNCEAPYEQTDGKRYFLPDAVASGATVSETDWQTILAAAKTSAAKVGATDEQVVQDQPGNHDVWFSGPAGMFIKIGSKKDLVISTYTGCRLPQDKK